MTLYHVISPVADVHEAPDIAAMRGKFETQLVYGEGFVVTEEQNGWCRGSCAHDGYSGYIDGKHLSVLAPVATHVVTASTTHAYRDGTIKSPVMHAFSFGSLITIIREDKDFAELADGSWIYKKHIALHGDFDTDIVATAQKFLETPYYWGGRSGFGIDCSGLAQVCLGRAGIAAPRDTEEQEKTLGQAVTAPQAGDLVFLPGHVGIMVDDKNIIHANAFHMKVVIEPLDAVAMRGKGVTSIRRISL